MFCDYSCVIIAYACQQLNRNMRKAKQRETRKKKEKENEYENVKVKHSASNFLK